MQHIRAIHLLLFNFSSYPCQAASIEILELALKLHTHPQIESRIISVPNYPRRLSYLTIWA